MKARFLGLLASLLLLFSSAPSQATTYLFDISVDGVFSSILPFGTIDVTSTGNIGTVSVVLPTGHTFSEFALNLVSGNVDTGGGALSVSGPASYGAYGPFNTVLVASNGSFGSGFTFTINNFAGLFNLTVNGQPIWFAAVITDALNTGAVVSDALVQTPLPGAVLLFASGLGLFGFLGWRRKRVVGTAAVAA
jgi:hypothetical protein